jgi:TRAP-type C4-dicarboxylate transport system substrate-binding protein
MRRARAALAAAVLVATPALTGCGPVGDGDTITLRVADWLPANHVGVREGIQPWMDRVTELTDGKVEFEYYGSEQLGPATDLYRLTRSGVVDVGFIVPNYVPEILSLATVAGLPGLAQSSCANSLGYAYELGPDGAVGQHEYAEAGLHALMVSATPAYELMTSKKQVTTPEQMAGLTIAMGGGAMSRLSSEVDAAPVTMGAPERYDAMRKGTIDATMLGFSTAPAYSMQEVVKHVTVGAGLSSSAAAYSISTRRWDGLPPDVQDAMTQASDEITRHLCEVLDEEDVASQQVMADAGVQLTPLTPAQQDAFRAVYARVQQAWLTQDLPADKRAYGEQAIADYLTGAQQAEELR